MRTAAQSAQSALNAHAHVCVHRAECACASQGATVLHVQYITPLLTKHEGVIDSALEEGLRKGHEKFSQLRNHHYGRVRIGCIRVCALRACAARI